MKVPGFSLTVCAIVGIAVLTLLPKSAAATEVLSESTSDKKMVLEMLAELSKNPQMHKESSDFVFEPEQLQKIVNRHKDLPLDNALKAIHSDLQSEYPSKIMDQYRFIFNDAGGALGQVAILYASSNEYLIFFGSPIPTGGFSGRYQDADFYDIMINGEMTTVIEGQTSSQLYRPGDLAVLKRGVAKGYRIDKSGWMLEYSRGKMLSNFAFGVIGPAMFITMDWASAFAQIKDFGSAMIKSTLSP